MSEGYRLVFSGEVEEGQHPAVVKKRLAAVLKLDEQRMDMLFSGKSVVVKKAADEPTAKRYQQAFKKAGAVLRVLRATAAEQGDAQNAQEANPPTPTPAPQPGPAQEQPKQPKSAGESSGGRWVGCVASGCGYPGCE